MNSYEKYRAIVRNTYRMRHCKQFGHIGAKSYFIKPIFLTGTRNAYLGNGVNIWHSARFEVISEWRGQAFTPKVVIGDNVVIGQEFHLTCAESVEIENGVVITGRVTITDITHCMSDINASALQQTIVTKPVKICENAFIGMNCVILPGVRIGKHAIVGANSVVTKDVPDYSVVAGAPAKTLERQ